jgi:hypothetical protein
MKKCILILSTIFASNSALANVESNEYQAASDLNVKLGACTEFEAGGERQSHLDSSEKNLSDKRGVFSFYYDTKLSATISKKHKEIEYGAKIILASKEQKKNIPNYNGSHIFIKGEFGNIEFGSPTPVAQSMMISDGSVPFKYFKKSIAHLKQNKEPHPSFLTGDGHFLEDDLRTINYYTPKFTLSDTTKMQLGVSYTADSSDTGSGSDKNKKELDLSNLHRFEINKSVTDAVTAGIKLEQKINNDIGLKLALTGEYGKASGKAKKYASKGDESPLEYKLANLRSYNIGSELKFSDFTFDACYGNLGKSFTTPEFHKSGTKSHYYNVGAAYKYEQTTAKLSYFGSELYKNKASSVNLNISHILAPGLKPYAEISSYTLKGKPEFHKELENKSTRGVVALIGFKLTL